MTRVQSRLNSCFDLVHNASYPLTRLVYHAMKRLFANFAGVLMLALLLPFTAAAQDGAVVGTITDAETGESLPGVNVQIVELGVGGATDAEGRYRIPNVPPRAGYTLRASFIGYQEFEESVSVNPGEEAVVDIALQPTGLEMTEIVVTAQGIEREARSLGYSVQEVSGESLEKGKETNFVNALQGKVAGVEITQQSGNVGGGSSILIRGAGSISGNNQPLFIVDGVPISNQNIAFGDRLTGSLDTGNRAMDISPANVESVTVLKGASAAALYGQRARNGVVLIETKKGRGAGPRSSVSVTSSLQATRPLVLPEYQNEYGPGDLGVYDSTALNGWGPLIEGQTVQNFRGDEVQLQAYPDNVAEFYDTGLTFTNNLAFSSSNEDMNFRLGLNNVTQGGIIPGSEMDRTNISVNAGTELENGFDANVSGKYITSATGGVVAAGGNDPSVATSIINFLPRTVSYDMLTPYIDPETGEQVAIDEFTNNPLWTVNENPLNTELQRVIGSGQIGYDFTDWLRASLRVGTDFYTEDRRKLYRKGTIGNVEGEFRDQIIEYEQLNADLIVTGQRDLTNDFSVDFTVGGNLNQEQTEIKRNEAKELSVDQVYSYSNALSNTPTNDFWKRRLAGVYGDLRFGFRDYLYLSLTGRNDWSSTLAPENRSFFYPSASLSFIFTDVLDLGNVVSYGKLRANIAQVGSDPSPYQLDFRYFPVSSIFGQYGTGNVFPYGDRTAYAATGTIPPTDLEPQTLTEYELGAELRFFNGRIGLDVSYYDRRTTNQILDLPIAQSTGFAARQLNVGEISNEGIEALLSLTPITTRDFSWDAHVNFASNEQTLVELAPGLEDYTVTSGFNSVQVKAEPGESFGLYGYTFLADSASGRPIIDPATGYRQRGPIERLGSVTPDFKVGFDNSFQFKGLSFGFLIDWKHGGSIYSETVGDLRASGLAEETLEGRGEGEEFIDEEGVIVEADGTVRDNDVPAESVQGYWDAYYGNSIAEGRIFDASYVKLREVTLGFNLPQSWLDRTPLGQASLTLVGRNLWILHKNVPHIDPETNLFGAGSAGSGYEFYNVPSTRSLGATLNFTF